MGKFLTTKARIVLLKRLASATARTRGIFEHKNIRAFQKNLSERGFTLVEMLVSIGIFTMVTTVAVFNNNQFNSSIILTNLAYEIALSVREAQVYGISVKAGGSGGAPVFTSGYGIHFNLDSTANKEYVLFEDEDADHSYDGTGEKLQQYSIKRGNYIKKVCLSTGGSPTCYTTGTVDVTFLRPDPEAFIRRSGACGNGNCQKAEVCLSSPGNSHRKIVVEITGQIFIDSTDVSNCS